MLACGIAISELEQEIERRGGEHVRGRRRGLAALRRGRRAGRRAARAARPQLERRLEQLEAERERFEAFGRIAAGLAHEIKNPLGGIRGAAELLAARATDDKTRETAALVVREATRIARLVDELIVFARGDELRLAPVNIHACSTAC